MPTLGGKFMTADLVLHGGQTGGTDTLQSKVRQGLYINLE